MMERTDVDGRWTSDDGVAWTLVEPSQVYLDREVAQQAAYEEWLASRPPTPEESTRLAARLSVVAKVRADTLDDDTVAGLVSIFPDLAAGLSVATGEVYAWDGTLVEAIQPHTVEGWWLDLAALPPSLYKVHRTDDGTGPIPWQTGISLTTDDQVWYGDILYDVLQAHTTQETWTPPASPALFEPAA